MTRKAKLKHPDSVDEVVSRVQARGSHFFDADTMCFFGSRVLCDLYRQEGGECCFFVTSERDKVGGGARAYSVRLFHTPTAQVDSVGVFNELTRSVALRVARDLGAGTMQLPIWSSSSIQLPDGQKGHISDARPEGKAWSYAVRVNDPDKSCSVYVGEFLAGALVVTYANAPDWGKHLNTEKTA